MVADLTTADLFIYVTSLIIGITIHEAMHAYTARWLGDTTAEDVGRLTLNPLRHIDPYTTILLPIVSVYLFHVPILAAKPVPFNPNRVRYGEMGAALVGLAGPLTNLVLAIVAGTLIRVDGLNMGSGILNALEGFTYVNIALFAFNMIPFPPLDGSRALYAIAPDGLRSIMRTIEGTGIIAIALFMVLFFTVLGPIFVNVLSFCYQLVV